MLELETEMKEILIGVAVVMETKSRLKDTIYIYRIGEPHHGYQFCRNNSGGREYRAEFYR